MDLSHLKDNSIPQITPPDHSIRWICALSYLGPLLLIPLIYLKGSVYAIFHVNQGIILLIVSVSLSLIAKFARIIPLIGGIISLCLTLIFLMLAAFGIITTLQGRAERLPVIGGFTIYRQPPF